MWNLPRPGIESVSPALAGRFLSSAPPGKSQELIVWVQFLFVSPQSTKILHSDDWSSWLAETCLKKYMLDCLYLPFTKISYILTSPQLLPASLEQFLRVIWNAVLILPQINLTCNSHTVHFFCCCCQHKKGKGSRRAKTILKNVLRVFSFKLLRHHKTVDITTEFCRRMNFWGLHLLWGLEFNGRGTVDYRER